MKKFIITEEEKRSILQMYGLNEQQTQTPYKNIPLFGNVTADQVYQYSSSNNFIEVEVKDDGTITLLEKPGFKGIVKETEDGFRNKMNLKNLDVFPSNLNSKTPNYKLPIIPFISKIDDGTLLMNGLQIKFIPNKKNKDLSPGKYKIQFGEYPLTKDYKGQLVRSVNAIPGGDLNIYANEGEKYTLRTDEPPPVPRRFDPVDFGDLFEDNKYVIDENSETFRNFVTRINNYLNNRGRIGNIKITASASRAPATCCGEGGENWKEQYQNAEDPSGQGDAPNYYLAKARAENTKEVLMRVLGTPEDFIEIDIRGAQGPAWDRSRGDDYYKQWRKVVVDVQPPRTIYR